MSVSDSKARPELATHEWKDLPLKVVSSNTTYSEDFIDAKYSYKRNEVSSDGKNVIVKPVRHRVEFRTKRKPAKTGMMLVGLAGNNGSTVTAGIMANQKKLSWRVKEGTKKSNYYGSLTQATTIRIGNTAEGKEAHIPFYNVLPMVNPNDLVIGGWDIDSTNLGDAMRRSCVLDIELQDKLYEDMKKITPLPSVYYPDFIASNQSDRANNVVKGTKKEHLEHLRKDIRDFKKNNGLETVVVLWTANTERFSDVRKGLNTTAKELLASIDRDDEEVSPSQLFAVASILEGCPYINGSPQNTFVPGVVELAKMHGVYIGGDDFKSGQTKMKSVLVDFLVSAGIKPESIVSYNHLGNNDGKNLSAPKQFRSKEISKSNVVDDMVASNHILYDAGEHPDHVVVIKYVPYVRDSKRAMDEYTSSIFMGGRNTIVMHNTCEDSLLASPLIIDLVILTELITRITYKTPNAADYQGFEHVLSILSYLLKAPMVPTGTPIVNALFKQQRSITNILCACQGLPPDADMLLEHKINLGAPLPDVALEDLSAQAGKKRKL